MVRRAALGARTDSGTIASVASGSAPELVIELADGLDEPARQALDRAFQALGAHLREGFPPAVAAAVSTPGGCLGRAWGGFAKLPPRGVAVTPDTVFDLASLTKVMVTTPLCLMLEQAGAWSLDDPVRRWLPGFRHRSVTVRHCLAHVSGLPAHIRFWERAQSPAAIRAALYEVDLEAVPGERVVYSDLGFILLGWAVESCAGRPLDVLAREMVLRPLGMARSRFRPPAGWRRRVAASEVWGEVHDENARSLGGVSGHAGLFAPLDDVVRFAEALSAPDRRPGLPPYRSAKMVRRQAGEAPKSEVRGLGWRLQPIPMAAGWPPDTFGHTGFTGTSLLVAPGAGLAAVLLSNAVHPERRPDGAARVRVDFHAALVPLLKRAGDAGRGAPLPSRDPR